MKAPLLLPSRRCGCHRLLRGGDFGGRVFAAAAAGSWAVCFAPGDAVTPLSSSSRLALFLARSSLPLPITSPLLPIGWAGGGAWSSGRRLAGTAQPVGRAAAASPLLVSPPLSGTLEWAEGTAGASRPRSLPRARSAERSIVTMPSLACCAQNPFFLVPATPNDGCVLHPSRAHCLLTTSTIPWACPAQNSAFLVPATPYVERLLSTLLRALLVFEIDHSLLRMFSVDLSVPGSCYPKRRHLDATPLGALLQNSPIPSLARPAQNSLFLVPATPNDATLLQPCSSKSMA